MYMPWSGDSYALTSYFYTNISDMEDAIREIGLDDERVVVFLSTSSSEATMFEITCTDGNCQRVTLKEYTSPAFTTIEGLTSILNDVKNFAPSDVTVWGGFRCIASGAVRWIRSNRIGNMNIRCLPVISAELRVRIRPISVR